MRIEEYKQQLKNPIRQRTLTFLLKENEVLLGFKKRGFGKGNYLGIGGKPEEGETIEQAAIRESQEEVSVTPEMLVRVGTLDFFFPEVEDESWNQRVCVFTSELWEGKPQESEEIRPEWFNKDSLPLDSMWDDAKYWLPQILEGKKITGEFLFNKSLQVIEHSINNKLV